MKNDSDKKTASLSKKSKNQYLKLTLNSLKLTTGFLANKTVYDCFDLNQLLIFSPNCENKYAFSIKGIPRNKYSELMTKVFKTCEIQYFNFFEWATCKANASNKTNILKECKKAISENDKIAIVQNKSGIIKSFFTGLRNAIAHGNILEKEGRYYFYSLNKDSKNKSEEDKTISFLLIVNNLLLINLFVESLFTDVKEIKHSA